MTIQYRSYGDGTFVLHKVMVNNSKYSVYYNKEGKPHDAERFSTDNQIVYNVPKRWRNVWHEFAVIGERYKAGNNDLTERR